MPKHQKFITLLVVLVILATITQTVMASNGIFESAEKGDLNGVKELINKDPNLINATDKSGQTVLHYAASSGSVELAKFLIHKGLDVNVKDNDGITPLMYAVINNRIDMVKLLIEKKADLNLKDKQNHTILHLALVNTFYLIYDPTDPSSNKNGFVKIWKSKDSANIKLVELLVSGGIEIDIKDNKGITPLMYASQGFKNEKIVNILIEKGADVNAKDNLDYTPLLYTFSHSLNVESARLLIKKGANVNVKSKDGFTPLLLMAYKNYRGNMPEIKEMADLLISGGADVNAEDKSGNTPLSISLRSGIFCDASGCMLISINKTLAEVLVLNGADVNVIDSYGFTPLLYAARAHDKELLELLISKGADIKVRDKKNEGTLLHLAIMDFCYAEKNDPMAGKEGTIKFIIEPDPGKKELIKLVEFLISTGMNVNAKDKHGKTSLSYAKKGGQKEVVEILLKHGAVE